MVHRAPVSYRMPRFARQAITLAVIAGVAVTLYSLLSLCIYGTVSW